MVRGRPRTYSPGIFSTHLGLWVTPDGIQPLVKKVEAIANLQPLKTVRQLQIFMGIANYYRYMWPRRAHILTPITEFTSENTKIKWMEVKQKAFKETKRLIVKYALLEYTNFSKESVINKNA